MKIYQIHQNKLPKLIVWGNKIEGVYFSEAVETLKQENCTREYFYYFSINDIDFIVGNMEGSNFLSPEKTKLNIEHKRILKECIKQEVKIDKIYDISSI